MRALVASVVLAAGLAGCSGFSIGVRQDKDDAEALAGLLGGKRPGARFPARTLLEKDWTRLWVFPGKTTTTKQIEDRIGIPFPESDEDIPAGPYLVFADDEAVVSAFSFPAPARVPATCLRAERVALRPQTALTLLPGPRGTSRLSTAVGAARCR